MKKTIQDYENEKAMIINITKHIFNIYLETLAKLVEERAQSTYEAAYMIRDGKVSV